jgi:DNA end-binding protein Ku
MRAMWSGALNFGLINIPVKLYSASEDQGLHFHFLHKDDLSPIRFAKICKADGREIPFDDIVRGFEWEDGNYVVLTDEDLKKADVKKTKMIEIMDFVDQKEVDPMYFEKPYFLEPDKNADKPYALLREALKKSKKLGIARFVIREKEHLGAIEARGKVIVLEQMKFANELRDPKGLNLPGSENVQAKEVEMALKLIEQLTSKFKPEQYKDQYTEEVRELITQKAKGRKLKPKGKEPQPTKVADLMDILKASLEKEKKKTHASSR